MATNISVSPRLEHREQGGTLVIFYVWRQLEQLIRPALAQSDHLLDRDGAVSLPQSLSHDSASLDRVQGSDLRCFLQEPASSLRCDTGSAVLLKISLYLERMDFRWVEKFATINSTIIHFWVAF